MVTIGCLPNMTRMTHTTSISLPTPTTYCPYLLPILPQECRCGWLGILIRRLYGNYILSYCLHISIWDNNGPSSRVNETVDILKVELVYIDDEITSCDITPFLDECWELTTDITKVNHTKISEIPFYQYTHLAFESESNMKEIDNNH